MKIVTLTSIICSILFSFFTYAADVPLVRDVVKLLGPYNVSMQDVAKSQVVLYIPKYGIGTITLEGGDKFSEANENSSAFDLIIDKSNKNVTVKNSLSVGEYTTFNALTLCGKSVSVTVKSVSSSNKESTQEQPKLFIYDAKECGV